ncbi:hypothetical protein [Desulfogranum mediterraneum]|uniref:hypothetical protein n=1 Tax=Desulfogranum mediterraneum TaxID=160661 RepID=UPI00048C1BA6|nr:hypothetical protein [Desulfogranum mediterraneum]
MRQTLRSTFFIFLVFTFLCAAARSEAIPPEPSPLPECLAAAFEGPGGEVRAHSFAIDFNGRPAVGDLDNDGWPDYVISSKERIAAYDVCGRKIWDIKAGTNWEYPGHFFWNYTTYGYVGDADGDGATEFLHIGSDWRTLFVRDGRSGRVKYSYALSRDERWMYVFLARRGDDQDGAATRIVVASASYDPTVSLASIDLRGGCPRLEWQQRRAVHSQGMFMYPPPQTADLDGSRGDEIFHGALALRGNGELLWLADANSRTDNRGIHAFTVRDIDPSRPGLEAVYSLYNPLPGEPSIIAHGYGAGGKEIWESHSPHRNRHPHQHAVGDFYPGSEGQEILVRNGDGYNHWLLNCKGELLRRGWRVHPGWDGDGEYVQAVEWDHRAGTEVLYVERHMKVVRHRAVRPRLRVVSPLEQVPLTPIFGGGRMDDPQEWVGESRKGDFNPYEAAVLVIDLFNDGREELLTWGGNQVAIFYNSGSMPVPRRWNDQSYRMFKKISCPIYSPR